MSGQDNQFLNLVKNGSFEIDSNQDGKPDDWIPVEPIELDCKDSIAEKCSANINSQSDENNNINRQFLNLLPNTTYILSGWIKTIDVTGEGAQIYIYNAGTQFNPIRVNGTSDWQEYQIEFTTGESFENTRVNYRIKHGQGQAWFDDIKLIKKQ